jgi:hypothetical protein
MVSVILSKKVYMFSIPNGFRDSYFFFYGMHRDVYLLVNWYNKVRIDNNF